MARPTKCVNLFNTEAFCTDSIAGSISLETVSCEHIFKREVCASYSGFCTICEVCVYLYCICVYSSRQCLLRRKSEQFVLRIVNLNKTRRSEDYGDWIGYNPLSQVQFIGQRIIRKRILREWGGVWTGFMWLRLESTGGLL